MLLILLVASAQGAWAQQINTINGIVDDLLEKFPELSKYADKEANPLYPVPVLMNAKELEKFYYMLMEKETA